MSFLSRLFYKYALPALGAALIGIPSDTRAQDRPQRVPDDSLATKAVNDSILVAARQDFLKLSQDAGNNYSSVLDSISRSLNAYLQRHPGLQNSAVFIDPLKYDIGIALGIPSDSVVSKLVQQGSGYKPDKDDLYLLDQRINNSGTSIYGGEVYVTRPAALCQIYDTASAPIIIIPADYFFQVENIPGMTYAENIEFANRHEEWHAKDSRLNMSGVDVKRMEDKDDVLWLCNADALADPVVARAVVLVLQRESLADVASLGDMLRAGKNLNFSDNLIHYRETAERDPSHFTGFALRELKARIEKMGLEAFRALPDSQMLDIYYDIVAKSTLDAKSFGLMLQYENAPLAERQDMESRATKDPALHIALKFRRFLLDRQQAAPGEDAAPSAYIAARLELYEPLEALKKRATEQSGNVLPASLAKAFGSLVDDLQQEIHDYPSLKSLNVAKMMSLKSTFMENLATLNYAQLNNIKAKQPAPAK